MAFSIYRSSKGEAAVKARYSDLLRHWPMAKELRTITTRHGDTQVIACGDANNPPLLLLHGAASSSIRWLQDVETYCKSHRIFVVDIIGEPNNSANARPKPKTPAYREWLEDIVGELQLSQVALVGDNLGAWICLQYACAWPEKVDHLALLNPAGIVGTRWRFKFRTLLACFFGPLGRSLLMHRVSKGANIDQKFIDYHNAVRKYFKPRSRNLPKLGAKSLSQLYCPILLIVGKKDIVFSARKILLRLARSVPQVEVHYRKNDGHWLTGCTREIDRFLVTQYPAE